MAKAAQIETETNIYTFPCMHMFNTCAHVSNTKRKKNKILFLTKKRKLKANVCLGQNDEREKPRESLCENSFLKRFFFSIFKCARF